MYATTLNYICIQQFLYEKKQIDIFFILANDRKTNCVTHSQLSLSPRFKSTILYFDQTKHIKYLFKNSIKYKKLYNC